MLTVVPGDGSGHEGGKGGSLIDEIVREGARRMLAEALRAEVDAYIAAHAAERDDNGRRRKTPKITEVLPLLYLHGLSSGDFVPTLGQFLGSAAGLSAAVITPLTERWKAEQRAFAGRDLSGVDYVYLWADGIHVNIRLDEHKLCAPVLAVGYGTLGFWNALREVFPRAREGRRWFHKTEDKDHALAAVKAFEAAYCAKFPKATAKITDDIDDLLTFYDYPAEHWVHLRTTNPVESAFATVRRHTKVTKEPGSRAAGLAMARFERGILVERPARDAA